MPMGGRQRWGGCELRVGEVLVVVLWILAFFFFS